MRGPTGVTDTHTAKRRSGPITHGAIERVDSVDRPHPHDVAVGRPNRDTHRVIPAVFEPPQPVEEIVSGR
jgi:hypothetical protein